MAKMLTETEVGEMLGMSPDTLRTWRARGKGPPFAKLEGGVRYDEAAVKAWVEERTVDPGKAEEVES